MKYIVDVREAITHNRVTLKNTSSKEVFYVRPTDVKWRNSFDAQVSFTFKGQSFKVVGEVNSILPDF